MKIVTILFFIAINSCFAQTYMFDKLVKSEHSSHSFPDREQTFLFNSKDYSYSMKIFSKNDSLKSFLIDTKKNQVHYFNIDKKDSLRLNHYKTENYTPILSKYSHEFSDLKTRKNKKKILLTFLNEEKRKIAKYILTIKETDQNLFPVFKLTGAIEPFHMMDMQVPLNFIVLKSKGVNISRNSVEYKFKSMDDINVLIEIP